MSRTFTVLEVAEHIDTRVREVWDRQFWVRGEVSGLKRTARATWFDLVHTGDDGSVQAQLNVSMPAAKARLVARRLQAVGQPLEDGLEIRIKASLSFWVKGGRLSLSLADIDPTHTAGALAVKRRELLTALAADGSLDRNSRLPTPRLPLSLGLVTSDGSQAFHDLVDELRRSRFPFQLTLVSCRVQGTRAVQEVPRAIATLGGHDVDLILVTRGGGADIDLVTFDHADVARAVADAARPVWTGIGHHLDSPIAELVAARAFKTPTALAQGVVAAVSEAVAATEGTWQAIQASARARLEAADRALRTASGRSAVARLSLRTAAGRLDSQHTRLHHAADRMVAHRRGHLTTVDVALRTAARHAMANRQGRLDRAERLVDFADPVRLLTRGWSVTTTTDGSLVTGPPPAGTRLHTRTVGGRITSEVVDDDE